MVGQKQVATTMPDPRLPSQLQSVPVPWPNYLTTGTPAQECKQLAQSHYAAVLDCELIPRPVNHFIASLASDLLHRRRGATKSTELCTLQMSSVLCRCFDAAGKGE